MRREILIIAKSTSLLSSVRVWFPCPPQLGPLHPAWWCTLRERWTGQEERACEEVGERERVSMEEVIRRKGERERETDRVGHM